MRSRLKTIFELSRKRVVIAIILSILFIIAYWNIYNLSISSTNKVTSVGTELDQVVATSFSDNNIFRQSFWIHEHCKLNTVNIKMSTISDTVTVPSIYIAICDKFGNVIFEKNIDMSEIQDNSILSVDTQGIELNGSSRYIVMLKCSLTNADTDITPTVYTCEPDKVNDILYINGSSVSGAVMDASYEYTSITVDFYNIATLILGIACIIVCSLLHAKYFKWIPVILLLPFGLMIWFGCMKYNYWVNTTLLNTDIAKSMCRNIIIIIVIVVVILRILLRNSINEKVSQGKKKAFLCDKYNELNDRQRLVIKYIIGILGIGIIFCVQITIASRIYQKNGWDVTYIYDMAKSLYSDGTLGENVWYLQMFPNNKGLFVIFYTVMKLFGTSEDATIYWHLVVLNILMLDVAIVLAYKIAKYVFDRVVAIFSSVMIVILLGLSGWIVVPYTDTLSVWIPLCILWMLIKARECTNIYWKAIIYGAVGMMTILGYHIKPQCVIVVIAIAIIELVRVIKNKSWNSWKSIACWGVGFILGIGVFVTSCNIIPDSGENVANAIPMMHFLMMGTSENPTSTGIGGFNSDDTSYTYSYSSTDEMKTMCKQRYNMEMKNYGIAGFIQHIKDKAEWILSDGSFAWQLEGEFYTEDYSSGKSDNLQGKLREMYYGSLGGYDGISKMNYAGYITGIWLVVVLLFIVPFGRTDKVDFKMIIYLAAMGCIAFTLLFEGRSRYLINYIPFFCIIAAASLKTLLIPKKIQ